MPIDKQYFLSYDRNRTSYLYFFRRKERSFMKTKSTAFVIAMILAVSLMAATFMGILYFREQMVIDSAAQTAKIERNLSGR